MVAGLRSHLKSSNGDNMSTVITNDGDKRKGFKEQTLQRIQAAAETPVEEAVAVDTIEVEVPSNFSSLSDVELFGVLKHQELTPEQASSVIEQLRGRIPGTKEFRVVLQAPVAVQPKPQVVRERVYPELNVEVPEKFSELRIRDQFYYLINSSHLTIEEANDVMVAVRGGSPLKHKVTITEKPKVKFGSVEVSVPKLEVTLPLNFEEDSETFQRNYLRTTLRLTQKQTNDVILAIKGQVPRYFQVIFSTAEVKPVVEQTVTEPEPVDFPELAVTLPKDFGSLRPQDQYLFLKTELKLTGDQANDVIFAFKEQAPLKYKVILN